MSDSHRLSLKKKKVALKIVLHMKDSSSCTLVTNVEMPTENDTITNILTLN